MAALPEDPGGVPRTHMVAYNRVKLQFEEMQCCFWPSQAPGMYIGYSQEDIYYMYIIYIIHIDICTYM